MSSYDERFKFSENPKSAVFNRSLTNRPSPKKTHPHNSLERDKKLQDSSSSGNSFKGKVKKLLSIFEPTKSPKSVLSQSQPQPQSKPSVPYPRIHGGIVVYFTSLRGIRKTFQDCYAVRMILRGFRVMVDERDVSMDLSYKKELQSLLGEKRSVELPQVFIRGKHIGGADVIRQLYEFGELAKLLKGLPIRPPGYVCDGCGDVRFVPCFNCDGSTKVYDPDEDKLKLCWECNENGLIRCPHCLIS